MLIASLLKERTEVKDHELIASLLKEQPQELTFNQTYFNHCSFKLIQSLTQLGMEVEVEAR